VKEIVMKKLLAIAILSLSASGLALADEIGDFSYVKATQGQPFDGQTLGRAAAPVPVPTVSLEGHAAEVDWARQALESNG
jgi:hypothetical protein